MGLFVSYKGVHVNPGNVAAVSKTKNLRTIKEMRAIFEPIGFLEDSSEISQR